jgi:putative tricarboxylic transport membrane protein
MMRMEKARQNLYSTFVLLLFSIYISIESYRLGLGRWRMPGPGYFPFGAGVLMGIISLGILIKSLATYSGRNASLAPHPSEPLNWQNIVLTLAGMLAYVICLQWMGFIPGTFLLMTYFVRVIGKRHWPVSLITAVSITVAAYLLFELALDAQLPKGLLEFFL